MRTVLFFWVLLGWFSPVLSQDGGKSDSLVAVVQEQLRATQRDTARVTLMLRLSELYRRQGKSDSAYNRLHQSLLLAKNARHPLYLGRVYQAIGNYYSRKQPRQSIAANQKAVYYFQKAGQIPEATLIMLILATDYADNFEQAKSVEQCLRNLAYARRTGYYKMANGSYALLYTIHKNFGQKKKAFADLMEMKDIAFRFPTTENKYLAIGNLAEWYDHERDYARALPYWQRVSVMDIENGDPQAIVESYHCIAADLLELKEFDQAERYLDTALRIIEKHQFVSANFYVTLARLREIQGRLPESRRAALTAVTNARKTHQPFITRTGLEILGRIEEKQGKYREALLTTHQLKAVSDSIDEISHLRAINDIESRIALEKKEKDIAVLRRDAMIRQLEIERDRRQKSLYIGLAIGLALLLLLMGWVVQRARRKMRLLDEQKAEITAQAVRLNQLNEVKDKLFSLIGHDLRAPVIHLKLLIDGITENKTSVKWPGRQNDQLQRTVDSLFYTVDNLLHWASTQKEEMIVQRGAASLSDPIVETLDLFEAMIRQKNIGVEVDVPQQDMVFADEGQLQVVIRNILHNAIKFTPVGGAIRISLDDLSTTETVLDIADSGIGMDPQNVVQTAGTAGEKGTGLGLLVCREFMTQNGGMMEIDSSPGHGTTVRLIFPSVERKVLTPSCGKTGYSY